jgi:predicted amino acid racemase
MQCGLFSLKGLSYFSALFQNNFKDKLNEASVVFRELADEELSVKPQTNFDHVIQIIGDFSRHEMLIIAVNFVRNNAVSARVSLSYKCK